MRVFAGPNGSGKSTMYEQVRTTVVNGRPVDLGNYVNPDVIARNLSVTEEFDFTPFKLKVDQVAFGRFARGSGLLRTTEDRKWFNASIGWGRNSLKLSRSRDAERIAQIVAQFLVQQFIEQKHKFSFETVFSHPSKLDAMERAKKLGFKVYLYFIATNSAEINKDRVRTRVLQKGHNVPEHLIEKRYGLSLGQLLPAIEHCYHAFFFDNSGSEPVMFAEMKETPQGKQWAWNTKAIPDWFIRAYLLASEDPQLADVARIALAERT